MAGGIESPLTMSAIRDWQDHNGFLLMKWERSMMFDAHRAARHAHSEIVKWHAARKPINLDDKDKGNLNGHRRTRV